MWLLHLYFYWNYLWCSEAAFFGLGVVQVSKAKFSWGQIGLGSAFLAWVGLDTFYDQDWGILYDWDWHVLYEQDWGTFYDWDQVPIMIGIGVSCMIGIRVSYMIGIGMSYMIGIGDLLWLGLGYHKWSTMYKSTSHVMFVYLHLVCAHLARYIKAGQLHSIPHIICCYPF